VSEEDPFIHAIFAAPQARTTRAAYADWLDEHGEPRRAEYVRLLAALGELAAGDPRAAQTRDRRIVSCLIYRRPRIRIYVRLGHQVVEKLCL
jgi:uncharacterized protein (TIGR02996 family)